MPISHLPSAPPSHRLSRACLPAAGWGQFKPKPAEEAGAPAGPVRWQHASLVCQHGTAPATLSTAPAHACWAMPVLSACFARQLSGSNALRGCPALPPGRPCHPVPGCPASCPLPKCRVAPPTARRRSLSAPARTPCVSGLCVHRLLEIVDVCMSPFLSVCSHLKLPTFSALF